MKKLKNTFLNLSLTERLALIISLISSAAVIVFGVLQLAGVFENAIALCEIFMGIVLAAQALLQWKKSKVIAIFSLSVAVFIFAVAVFVFFHL